MNNLFKKEHYTLLIKALNVYRTVSHVVEDNNEEMDKIDELLDDLFELHDKYDVSDEKLGEILEEFEVMCENYNEVNISLFIASEIAAKKLEKQYSKPFEELDDKIIEEQYIQLVTNIMNDIHNNGVNNYLKYE